MLCGDMLGTLRKKHQKALMIQVLSGLVSRLLHLWDKNPAGAQASSYALKRSLEALGLDTDPAGSAPGLPIQSESTCEHEAQRPWCMQNAALAIHLTGTKNQNPVTHSSSSPTGFPDISGSGLAGTFENQAISQCANYWFYYWAPAFEVAAFQWCCKYIKPFPRLVYIGISPPKPTELHALPPAEDLALSVSLNHHFGTPNGSHCTGHRLPLGQQLLRLQHKLQPSHKPCCHSGSRGGKCLQGWTAQHAKPPGLTEAYDENRSPIAMTREREF
ncbi:hypothetical protein KIL84_011922 [Mauremys mutica]|uniref:Maestro/Maestro-like HEAT-repeats domain-containing protein n=1 Tax=Mauremys mutica TaxID=74926 RepID=A0A9D3XFP5_9SAUR|nr:hypothetical protein KIL84_011922 [Mauremys mutica]